MEQDAKEVYATLDKTRLNNAMSDEEQVHYFGLCKPDHSDCLYKHCGIRTGQLPPQRIEEK